MHSRMCSNHLRIRGDKNTSAGSFNAPYVSFIGITDNPGPAHFCWIHLESKTTETKSIGPH